MILMLDSPLIFLEKQEISNQKKFKKSKFESRFYSKRDVWHCHHFLMEGNRDEAERCISIATKHLKYWDVLSWFLLSSSIYDLWFMCCSVILLFLFCGVLILQGMGMVHCMRSFFASPFHCSRLWGYFIFLESCFDFDLIWLDLTLFCWLVCFFSGKGNVRFLS